MFHEESIKPLPQEIRSFLASVLFSYPLRAIKLHLPQLAPKLLTNSFAFPISHSNLHTYIPRGYIHMP